MDEVGAERVQGVTSMPPMVNPLFPANVHVAIATDNRAFEPDRIDDVTTEKSDVTESMSDIKSDVTSEGSSDGGFNNYVTSVRTSQRRNVATHSREQQHELRQFHRNPPPYETHYAYNPPNRQNYSREPTIASSP